MTHIDMAIVTKDGIELYAQQWLVDNPKAFIMVVHGMFEHSSRYDHVGKYFNAQGISVAAFDLRGHGCSQGRNHDVKKWTDLQDDLQIAVETLVFPVDCPWGIYAHSLGGLITTGYLLDKSRPQPDFAILSAPAIEVATPARVGGLARMLAVFVPVLRVTSLISGDDLSCDAAVGRKAMADPLVNVRSTVRMTKRMKNEQRRLKPLLTTIDTPLWIIHGGDDPHVLPHTSEPLGANVNAMRKVYPGLRHECHNESCQIEVLQDMREWLMESSGVMSTSPQCSVES